jgi:sugar phosphate isomerase/epimerase
MPSTARNVGVQSWTFRNFKPIDAMLAQVKAAGLDRIELCGAHANFEDPSTWQATVDACKAAGVTVESMGVQTFTNNYQKEKLWCEFAKKIGARHISAHFQVSTFREAVASARALAEAYDLRIAIHCHGGYMFGGSVDVISHLLELGGPRIGVCIDTAWCMQSGNANPADWAKKWAGRIYGIHYKDFVWDRTGKWSETVAGEGNLNLPQLLKVLDETSFDGYAVVEYEAQAENPGPSVKAGVAKVKAA